MVKNYIFLLSLLLFGLPSLAFGDKPRNDTIIYHCFHIKYAITHYSIPVELEYIKEQEIPPGRNFTILVNINCKNEFVEMAHVFND